MLVIFRMTCMTFTKVNTTKKIDRLSGKNKEKAWLQTIKA